MFRLEDCADDVVALADELGVRSFIPVGYSMGGPIAQLVWKRHPSRVEGMVLCATRDALRVGPRPAHGIHWASGGWHSPPVSRREWCNVASSTSS